MLNSTDDVAPAHEQQLAVMPKNWGESRPGRRGAGLAMAAGLHLLLAAAWQWQRLPTAAAPARVVYLDWVRTPARALPTAPASRKEPDTAARAAAAAGPAPARASVPVPDKKSAAEPATVAVAGPDAHTGPSALAAGDPLEQTPPPTAPAQALRAADMLSRARNMAGGIDRQLRRESGQPASATADSRYAHFLAGLETATAKKWVGVAKVSEIVMPGSGDRLYKISNGNSTYCVQIYHANIGIDQYEWHRNNFHAITCPK